MNCTRERSWKLKIDQIPKSSLTLIAEKSFAYALLLGRAMIAWIGGKNIEAMLLVVQIHLLIEKFGDHMRITHLLIVPQA